jgi:hypothetical protein
MLGGWPGRTATCDDPTGGVPHSGYLRQATPAVHRSSGFENTRRYPALLVLNSSLKGLEVRDFLCVASAWLVGLLGR